jgi:hypothetical protein
MSYDAKLFRTRAFEASVHAKLYPRSEHKNDFLVLAHTYERLAELTEKLESAEAPLLWSRLAEFLPVESGQR